MCSGPTGELYRSQTPLRRVDHIKESEQARWWQALHNIRGSCRRATAEEPMHSRAWAVTPPLSSLGDTAEAKVCLCHSLRRDTFITRVGCLAVMQVWPVMWVPGLGWGFLFSSLFHLSSGAACPWCLNLAFPTGLGSSLRMDSLPPSLHRGSSLMTGAWLAFRKSLMMMMMMMTTTTVMMTKQS